MKKPKFNQLRGTYAHALRHRICLGFSAAAFVITVICQFGLSAIVTSPASRSKVYADKILPRKQKLQDWLVFAEVEDGPEL